MKFNKKFYKFCVFILKFFVKIFFPYEVTGQENIKNLKTTDSGCIICSNHVSMLDPIFLMVSCDYYDIYILFMAKIELFKNKFFGYILSLLGVFPVNRGKGDTSAIEHAINIIKSKKNLGIFIEGTRSKTGDFLRPKSGVSVISSQTKADVLPVCITGSSKNNKVKIFRKTYINYGEIIKYNNINNNLEHKNIRNFTNNIMDNIKNLRNKRSEII